MRIEAEARSWASRQHGNVAIWQLRAMGATATELERLRSESPNWHVVSDRVLRRTGVAPSERSELMAAVLDASPGAAISGPTAAAMWGAPGFRIEPIHVVRHRGISRRPSPLAVVHEVVDLMPQHIKLIDGVPVVSPSRTVCELAGLVGSGRVARALDWMWREHLLDGVTFGRTVGELAGRGRKGSTLLRELDAARGPDYVPPGSGLEARFEEVLARAGERPMRRQVDTGDDESWCGRVDFRDDELPLVVEVQSEKYHSSLVDREADAKRKHALEAAGFEVLEVWDFQVWHRPHEVVELIRSRRAQLRARRRDAAPPNPRRRRPRSVADPSRVRQLS